MITKFAFDSEKNCLVRLESEVVRRINRKKRRNLSPLVKKLKQLYIEVAKQEKDRVLQMFEHVGYYLYAFNIASSENKVAIKMVARIPKEVLDELAKQIDIEAYKSILRQCYIDAVDLANLEVEAHMSYILGFKVRHKIAEEWIEKNLSKYIDKYVPNIEFDTKESIVRAIKEGVVKGEGIEKIKERISEAYDDLIERKAEIWARTEVNRAYSYSLVESYRDVGVRKKYWIGSGSPYYFADVCIENEIMGEIDIDESFFATDGSEIDAPPAHPNCMCSIGITVEEDWEPKNIYFE